MGRLTQGIAIILALFMAGCSGVASSYSRTLRHHTRHRQVYSLERLRAELIWHATLITPELRGEYVSRGAQLRGWSPELVDRSLPYTWSATGTNFFVSIYAPKEFNNLSLNEEHYWHIELTLPSGDVVEPSSIDEVELTPLDRKLFPHLTQWSRGYFVRFSTPLPDGPIELSIKGLYGKARMVWK